ncbi:hypothetical protein C6H88_02325 [Chlamydia muridarum str. Nigg]|jgi:hypothetical protein|nr:hypothetical protein [Chlamydia muridarum]UFT31932.1 hypothetical protein FTN65_02430 [Chlamydia trachomatis]AHH22838.1 hypothetical protein TAC_02375 [Chlamydia muridarum str. Nigg3 CMUT3-5]AHH23763.1 hypothetical protein Y015_02375 [Chlamydia muridarum str. Nigg CM972]AID37974.1 hypothetical protein BB17_02415 [Chlamydia muridarum str. Nigg 2 MCR]AIT90637.1 hypothetical protein NC80_02250 [Chlamydia muridarum]
MLSKFYKLSLSAVLLINMFSPVEVFSAEGTTGFIGRMKSWISGEKTSLPTTEDLQTSAITKVSDLLSWKRYDYTQEGGFSVQFPEFPEHSGQIVEIPQSDLAIRYDTYVAETPNDSTVYVVSVWEYPEKVDISKPELNLQEGFSGMLYALPESQVLYLKATEVQGHKALEFWVACEDVYFRGMLVSVNHTLYQVFMVYKGRSPEVLDKEYNIFIQSFKVTKVRNSKKMDIRKRVSL